MEEKRVKVTMVVSGSFKEYVRRHLTTDYRDGDLEIGFTKIVSSNIGGHIYFGRPPKNKLVKGVIKKRDLDLKEPLKNALPDLLYFV